MKPHSAAWYKIGTALNVPKQKLDAIAERSANKEKKLERLIETWMEVDEEYTWQKLIDTLLEVDLVYTAKWIEEKAREKIRASTEKERSENPTLQPRFKQYWKSIPRLFDEAERGWRVSEPQTSHCRLL